MEGCRRIGWSYELGDGWLGAPFLLAKDAWEVHGSCHSCWLKFGGGCHVGSGDVYRD